MSQLNDAVYAAKVQAMASRIEQQFHDVQHITVLQLQADLAQHEDIWLVDCRTSTERSVSMIPDAMTPAGAPQPLTRDIVSTYTGIYFTVNGSEHVGQALKGTRPGHPYADAVFAFCISTSIA